MKDFCEGGGVGALRTYAGHSRTLGEQPEPDSSPQRRNEARDASSAMEHCPMTVGVMTGVDFPHWPFAAMLVSLNIGRSGPVRTRSHSSLDRMDVTIDPPCKEIPLIAVKRKTL